MLKPMRKNRHSAVLFLWKNIKFPYLFLKNEVNNKMETITFLSYYISVKTCKCTKHGKERVVYGQ